MELPSPHKRGDTHQRNGLIYHFTNGRAEPKEREGLFRALAPLACSLQKPCVAVGGLEALTS